MRYFALVVLCSLFHPCIGQDHPLVGTWEMVYIKGVNAEGEPFFLDSTTVRETKIITDTHYILLARDKVDDGWRFNRSYAGTVRMDGKKYYETPLLSSLPLFDNVTTDFTWEIIGDQFIQSGKITRPDGKVILIERFVFHRVRANSSQSGLTGVWKLERPQSAKGLLIVTATHWIGLVMDGTKLVWASLGSQTMRSAPTALTVTFSSHHPFGNLDLQHNGKRLKVGEHSFEKQ